MDAARRRPPAWLICLGLAAAVFAAYAGVRGNDFVSYDDPDYVLGNKEIQHGVTAKSILWAFTTKHAGNWHPLTWVSHMIDCQIYGLKPAGHHLTNVALHMASSITLFLLLLRLTRETWPSAMVAALFALDPLHVESVAWVSERKDVLSALFWMLTLLAYARWVGESGINGPERRMFYILSVVFYALGLLAKPMVVTLPFVLLLLDYWPLGRRAPLVQLLVEKIPFFILSAALCAVTVFVQSKAELPLASLAWEPRLANVLVSYVRYATKLFWPEHQSIFYPILRWAPWQVAGAAALLALMTAVAFWRRQTQPWLMVGWLWYLGTLVPVIGLLQVGIQGMAERYSYLPSVGLFLAVVWTVRAGVPPLRVPMVAGAGVLILSACLFLTMRQVSHWVTTEKLFQQALANTRSNFFAIDVVGSCKEKNGYTNAAIADYRAALSIKPDYVPTRNRLGRVLLDMGRVDEALVELQRAVKDDAEWADSHYNLGYALLAKNRVGEALDQFQAQVNLEPDEFKAEFNMGLVLLQNGLAPDAVRFLEKAVKIDPTDAEARYNLANALFRSGHAADAISQYEKLLELKPNHFQARNDLAWILACSNDSTVRNGPRAVELALRANELARGQNPVLLGTLAAAYAETGKFSEAIAAEKQAVQLATAQTNASLAEVLEKRLHTFEARAPWREAPKAKAD